MRAVTRACAASSTSSTAACSLILCCSRCSAPGRPEHVDHLTAFEAESFGGPDDFTRQLGFAHLIDVHRGLKITEPQRQRFVQLYLAAADTAGLPDDPPFREALRSHVEFGSHVALQNSHAETDDQLHPLREVPRWEWPGG